MFRSSGTLNSLAVTGCAAGLISFIFGWLALKPNRLATGTSINVWDSFGWNGAAVIGSLWLICLAFSLYGKNKSGSLVLGITANLILITAMALAGAASSRIISTAPPLTRVSLSGGIWITLMAVFLVIFAARSRLRDTRIGFHLISWSGLVIVILLLISGKLNNISILQEFAAQKPRFLQELYTHVVLFSSSTAVGVLLGVPLGIWAARSKRAEKPVFFLAGIAQTIPSLALFGLLIVPLSALSNAIPRLKEIGIAGIGAAPAIIALIIYSLLPIIQNTFAGFRQVDSAVIEASSGMGMSRLGVLRRIELPLAAPLIMEGIRTSAVQAVGNTAVAALIGAGGMGQLIFQGLGQAASDLIILGSLPIIVLALITDAIMRIAIRVSTPRGVAVKEV